MGGVTSAMNPPELYRDILNLDMRGSLYFVVSNSKFHRKNNVSFSTPFLTKNSSKKLKPMIIVMTFFKIS